jgi:hypothetical protein
VGEIGGPQDVLDTEVMALAEPKLVVHEGDRHVALEVLGRRHLEAGEVVNAGGLRVEPGQEAGDPIEAGFDEDDFELREALKGSGENPPGDHLGQAEGGE